jgi:putative oxidoreductase
MNSSTNNYSGAVSLVGRVFLAILFLLSGFSKFANPSAIIAYIGAVGMPAPSLAFALSLVFEIGGGLLLLAGYRVKAVAAALAVFTLLTAAYFHHDFADQNQMIHFLKNIAITGGLLQVVAFGAGALSIDRRRVRGGVLAA